jgi:hypothetical protein
MKHATTRMVFSYWDALRGERAAPERGEIEPGEIRCALADTFILELAPDRSARIRLAGTRLCAFFNRELKGERFDLLWSFNATSGPEEFIDLVIDETAGIVAGVTGTTAEGGTANFELVLLPLRHRGKPNARILGALSPALIPPWIGFQPITRLEASSMRILSTARGLSTTEISRAGASPEEKRRRFVLHAGGQGEAAV